MHPANAIAISYEPLQPRADPDGWGGIRKTKARVVSLNWYAYEVSGSGVTLNMMTPLMMLPEWPRTPMLTDADGRVSLEMTRDGRVQWRLEGSELKGWLRDEESRQSDPAPH